MAAEDDAIGQHALKQHVEEGREEGKGREGKEEKGREGRESKAESGVLRLLDERPRGVMGRAHLRDAARGRSLGAFDRSIDLLVSRLRQKLG
ncbi:hypothetical protein B1218_39120, partial [Pseudomonas ogarae]